MWYILNFLKCIFGAGIGGIFVGAGVKIGIGIGIGTEKVPLMKGFFSEKELPAKEHKFFALKEFSKKNKLLTDDLAQEQTLQ